MARTIEDAVQTVSVYETCPACGHDRTARSSLGVANWLRLALRLRPLAAECAYDESSAESGSGLPGPCGCRHPAHGS